MTRNEAGIKKQEMRSQTRDSKDGCYARLLAMGASRLGNRSKLEDMRFKVTVQPRSQHGPALSEWMGVWIPRPKKDPQAVAFEAHG